MNFNLIEGAYPEYDKIHDDFVNDYIYNNELKNPEIQKKYGLTRGEFNDFANEVKKEFGLTRRPTRFDGKYYYRIHDDAFVIQKSINGVTHYFGVFHDEGIVRKIVELCKKVCWDIDTCNHIRKNWREYV